MSTDVSVIDAFPSGRGEDALALVFEYMAATQAEIGRPLPAGIAELPDFLRRECQDLQGVYQPPGALLIADCDGQLAGCVGLAAVPAQRTVWIRRLYVRSAFRGHGFARVLMGHAHDHAARHDMTRLILNVLPARGAVISFYRGLGYTETEPFETGSPLPMIYMERPVAGPDLLTV